MKTEDRNSLMLALLAMTRTRIDWVSDKEKDLAEYALIKIHQANFRMDCLEPAVKAIIKMAFMTKDERRTLVSKGEIIG